MIEFVLMLLLIIVLLGVGGLLIFAGLIETIEDIKEYNSLKNNRIKKKEYKDRKRKEAAKSNATPGCLGIIIFGGGLLALFAYFFNH